VVGRKWIPRDLGIGDGNGGGVRCATETYEERLSDRPLG
jgi:hypothetical protein